MSQDEWSIIESHKETRNSMIPLFEPFHGFVSNTTWVERLSQNYNHEQHALKRELRNVSQDSVLKLMIHKTLLMNRQDRNTNRDLCNASYEAWVTKRELWNVSFTTWTTLRMTHEWDTLGWRKLSYVHHLQYLCFTLTWTRPL